MNHHGLSFKNGDLSADVNPCYYKSNASLVKRSNEVKERQEVHDDEN